MMKYRFLGHRTDPLSVIGIGGKNETLLARAQNGRQQSASIDADTNVRHPLSKNSFGGLVFK
jgi:hypothetical protein